VEVALSSEELDSPMRSHSSSGFSPVFRHHLDAEFRIFRMKVARPVRAPSKWFLISEGDLRHDEKRNMSLSNQGGETNSASGELDLDEVGVG